MSLLTIIALVHNDPMAESMGGAALVVNFENGEIFLFLPR